MNWKLRRKGADLDKKGKWQESGNALNILVICKRTFPKKKTCVNYIFTLKNMKIHFITSYVPNSKFKLHRTCKFCFIYELRYTQFFLFLFFFLGGGAKTEKLNLLHLITKITLLLLLI